MDSYIANSANRPTSLLVAPFTTTGATQDDGVEKLQESGMEAKNMERDLDSLDMSSKIDQNYEDDSLVESHNSLDDMNVQQMITGGNSNREEAVMDIQEQISTANSEGNKVELEEGKMSGGLGKFAMFALE
jgi:hypothetical protein